MQENLLVPLIRKTSPIIIHSIVQEIPDIIFDS